MDEFISLIILIVWWLCFRGNTSCR